MKTFLPHASQVRAIAIGLGHVIGLIFDDVFLVFALITMSLMLAFCTVLAILDSMDSPSLAFGTK
jgi:hypothetical protein